MYTIRIFTWSCPAVGFRRMETDGSLAGLAIFLPVQVLSRLFRRLFTEALETAFTAGQLAFFSALALT